ncbi:MAG: VWA domain-containing protein [Treponema sp.]|jgi:uncharacterized protein YegL|nr:VWA domain-containing protein [Treponema sp.]
MNDLIVQRNNDLVVNPTPRCACILVLDTSGSMSGQPINELNQGVIQFIEEVKNDELAQYSVEVGVVTAGPDVQQQLQITPAHLIALAHTFSAGGGTPLGEAVSLALDLIEVRKGEYKSKGVPYYQPWLVLISDGEPTDAWQDAATRARLMADNRNLVVMPIGVSSADLNKLSQFSNRPAKLLAGLKFREFFAWLSTSMARVSISGSTTATVNLPPTGSWDSI